MINVLVGSRRKQTVPAFKPIKFRLGVIFHPGTLIKTVKGCNLLNTMYLWPLDFSKGIMKYNRTNSSKNPNTTFLPEGLKYKKKYFILLFVVS